MSSNIKRRGSSSSPSGKQRRKSGPRSLNQLNIDVAEARRQVYHALLLHRTSPRFSSSSTSSPSHDVVNGTSTQLLQSMPLPEPVWSTTSPSVLPLMPYSGGAAMEAEDIEFEWGENQDCSYNWWLAFLKSLDSNISNTSTLPQEFKYPLTLGSSNWFFGQKPGGNVKVEEEDEQTPSPDEWLMIPTTENHEGRRRLGGWRWLWWEWDCIRGQTKRTPTSIFENFRVPDKEKRILMGFPCNRQTESDGRGLLPPLDSGFLKKRRINGLKKVGISSSASTDRLLPPPSSISLFS